MDSFDTAFTGCTTHAASLIAVKLINEGYSLVDYPWLIRLNPAAPWKTRGNGAVAILIHVDSVTDAERAIRLVKKAADAYLSSPAAAGKASLQALYFKNINELEEFMVARPRCLETLYRRGLHELVPLNAAVQCLAELGEKRAKTLYSIGSYNRGLIGATAALGYTPYGDYTFEMLVYRRPENWLKPRNVDPESIVEYDITWRPLTFMNYDYQLNQPLVAPHGYDPVLYGVRGENDNIVHKALERVNTGGEEPSHWMIFRSNQATGHHLRPKTVAATRPYDNPLLLLEVTREPRILKGGHVVVEAADHTGRIHIAAYRETGHVRSALLAADVGENIIVGGQAKQRGDKLTLNIEIIATRGFALTSIPFQQRCGFTHPPLARLHHLSLPYQRCSAPIKHRLHAPKELLLP